MSQAAADRDRPQLTRLMDREQLARKLELRLGEVVAHAAQQGFPPPVAYYRGRMLWDESSIQRWMTGKQNP
jgi:hypothetical protein